MLVLVAPAACVWLSLVVLPVMVLAGAVLLGMVAGFAGLMSPLWRPWSVAAAVLAPAAAVMVIRPR